MGNTWISIGKPLTVGLEYQRYQAVTKYAVSKAKEQGSATGISPRFQGGRVRHWLMNGQVDDSNRVGAPFVI